MLHDYRHRDLIASDIAVFPSAKRWTEQFAFS